MARQIIESPSSVPSWLQPLGGPTVQRLLAWEQAQADALLCDVFGYHALQAGGSALQALQANRMPHRWRAAHEFDDAASPTDLVFDSRAWPWAAESLDLVVLPHTLERSADPHACLREVERVLIAEGQVLIWGINPWSLWGRQLLRSQKQAAPEAIAPWPVQPIAAHRLRDWLHLLGFEVQLQRGAGWTPTWRSERWVGRWDWLNAIGQRWLPFLAGVYLIVATKRVPGPRWLEGRRWRKVPSRTAVAAPAASIEAPVRATHPPESSP
jgi:SAM-dependent methyltransferase